MIGLFIWMHYKMIRIIFFKNKNTSDKTLQLQRMLYKSILAQTLSFLCVYGLPVFIAASLVLTKFEYSSSVLILTLFCLNSYEIINYVIIFVFINYFRTFLKKLCSKFFSLIPGLRKHNNVIHAIPPKTNTIKK